MKKLLQILRKIFKIGFIVVISPLVYYLLLLTYCSDKQLDSKVYNGMKFNKKTWIDNKEARLENLYSIFPWLPHARCKMYNDIVTNHLKLGMKPEEVEGFLGSANKVVYCTDEKTKCLTYQLGNCHSIATAIVYYQQALSVCFNKKHEVTWFGLEENTSGVCKQKFYCTEEECKCTEITWCGNTHCEDSIECPFKIDRW